MTQSNSGIDKRLLFEVFLLPQRIDLTSFGGCVLLQIQKYLFWLGCAHAYKTEELELVHLKITGLSKVISDLSLSYSREQTSECISDLHWRVKIVSLPQSAAEDEN